ncbi:hypothetical protein TetV_032 [Tetraselmis virus 1]|uniref:Uncharacterized protein n=1 Tax=Tetraselmis virus 1 TaxID=2060617 RepID=A0A2P0VMK0_9VIRU|nr:hypothetical protein QJ968_gp032 [Tetraselmis virus 1]AUF82124.1 hypothetical protein TetV_032 [Tetraselmis virus 1]
MRLYTIILLAVTGAAGIAASPYAQYDQIYLKNTCNDVVNMTYVLIYGLDSTWKGMYYREIPPDTTIYIGKTQNRNTYFNTTNTSFEHERIVKKCIDSIKICDWRVLKTDPEFYGNVTFEVCAKNHTEK